MAFQDLLITEIFHSIQGETSLSGLRFAFIRLTGCNLRCTYCDSSYAFKNGKKMKVVEILEQIRLFRVEHVLITGGEPLLQRNTADLVHALRAENYKVSIETHGEISIADISPYARIIMDVKTPSSGMDRMGFKKNLPFLKSTDEVKFVIASQADYAWAKSILEQFAFNTSELLFSPAVPATKSPGTFPSVDARWLAERILEDQLPVRLQIQLHKNLWGADRTGV